MTTKKLFAGCLGIALLLFASPARVSASPQDDIDKVVIDATGVGSMPSSELTLTFDDSVTAVTAERELKAAFGELDDVSFSANTLRASASGPEVHSFDLTTLPDGLARTAGYHPIHCNSSYSFSDADGKFSVQRRCGSRLVPWGFRFSAALQSICVGYTVDETGLRWWRNGASQDPNSPHSNRGCGYQFHGTLNPVPKGSLVRYADHFSFRHDLGGGGNASLDISGKLEFLGSL